MDSDSEPESSSRHVRSRNRNRNRVLDLDSLRTGIGIEKTGTGTLWCSCFVFADTVSCGSVVRLPPRGRLQLPLCPAWRNLAPRWNLHGRHQGGPQQVLSLQVERQNVNGTKNAMDWRGLYQKLKVRLHHWPYDRLFHFCRLDDAFLWSKPHHKYLSKKIIPINFLWRRNSDRIKSIFNKYERSVLVYLRIH